MVLIIHHLESMWAEGLRRLFGQDMSDVMRRLACALENNSFDRVILTQFENFEAEDIHHETGLAGYVDMWREYAYGWDLGDHDTSLEEMPEFVEGGSHSRHVWVPDWLHELKNKNVKLCGAFDGECIEDMEIALKAVGAKIHRWEEFIY